MRISFVDVRNPGLAASNRRTIRTNAAGNQVGATAAGGIAVGGYDPVEDENVRIRGIARRPPCPARR
jgi:hypothetical protein